MSNNQTDTNSISYFTIRSSIDEGVIYEKFIQIIYDKNKYLDNKKDLRLNIAEDIINRPWLYIEFLSPGGSYNGILQPDDYRKFVMDPNKLIKGIDFSKYNRHQNFVKLTLVPIIHLDNDDIENLSVFILYVLSDQPKKYYTENDGINVFIAKNSESVINFISNKDIYKNNINNTINWAKKNYEYIFKTKYDVTLDETNFLHKSMAKTPLGFNPLINCYHDDFKSILLLRTDNNIDIHEIIKNNYCYVLSSRNTWREPFSLILQYVSEDKNIISKNIINTILKYNNDIDNYYKSYNNNIEITNDLKQALKLNNILSSNYLIGLPFFTSNELLNRIENTTINGDSDAKIEIIEIIPEIKIDLLPPIND